MAAAGPEDQRPILNLVGEKVALGPLCRELIPLAQRWLGDPEILRYYGDRSRVQTREALEEWYERASVGGADRAAFSIYERATMRLIGYTRLRDVDYANLTGRFGILIGEKSCWGRGYGAEAARLALDYAFGCLGLHSVMLAVHSGNERAIRAYARAGFREFGRRREAIWDDGQAHDVVCMECLATEYRCAGPHPTPASG